MRSPVVAVFLSLLLSVVYSTAQNSASEQTSFCDEGPDDLQPKPVELPKAVLTALMNTREARKERQYAENQGKRLDSAKLFRGAKINLANSPDTFFLVIGKSPMSGADNAWFWVVRQSGQKASILLWAGANCLSITKHRTLGFRDISTSWASASEVITETYSYDGKAYKLKKKKSER